MINTKHKKEATNQIKFLLKTVYYAYETINQTYKEKLAPANGPFGIFFHVPCIESPISVCVGNKSKLFTENVEGEWKICIYCKKDILDKTEEGKNKPDWR